MKIRTTKNGHVYKKDMDKALNLPKIGVASFSQGNTSKAVPVFGSEESGFFAYNPTKKHCPLVQVLHINDQCFSFQ